MRLFKGHRERTQERFIRRGLTDSNARLAAVAMHPFVGGSPKPASPDFAKAVRRFSWDFVHTLKNAKSEEIAPMAVLIVQMFCSSAEHFGETYYREFFLTELGAAGYAEATASFLAMTSEERAIAVARSVPPSGDPPLSKS